MSIRSFKDDANTLEPLKVTSANISWLHFDKQTLKFFPKNIENTFANLTTLKVISCGLTSITRDDCKGLWNLSRLELDCNKLTILHDDLFADMRNLQYVSFDNNKLRFLSSKLLKPIEKTVMAVSFKNNVRINDNFDKNVACKRDLEMFSKGIDENCLKPQKKTNQKSDRLENLQAKFESFQISSKFSDFTIKFHEKSYEVRKCVFAAQSSVFEEMFSNNSADLEQPLLNVKNFSDKAFESFLSYFYTGRVDAGVTPVEMIQLASAFNVPDLKTKCVDKILENLSETNALEIFNIGHDYNSEELIQLAFNFIKRISPLFGDELRNDREGLNKLINIGENVESWD